MNESDDCNETRRATVIGIGIGIMRYSYATILIEEMVGMISIYLVYEFD